MFFHKMLAFIKKDFLIATSYKLTFILYCLGGFIPLLIFYFIAKVSEKPVMASLGMYGGRYFPYVLIGLAFIGYFGSGRGIFFSNIRREQLMGTLEAILVSPTNTSTVIICMGLWNLISTIIITFIYLLCGGLFLGVDFSNANILSCILAFVLTLICSISIGIIFASYIMVYKIENPFLWIFNGLSALFGGVFFPITILPKGLRLISYLLPITYSLKTLRLSLLQGYSFMELVPDIVILFFFSIFLLFLSIQIFKYTVKKSKKDGSLLHY